jgi:peptidyl-prolyl cis-trans isomerase C
MTTGPRLRLRGALVAVAALAWSCGNDASVVVNGPLVEIGDWSADTAELISYRGKLPESLLPTGENEEVIRSLLVSLIDRRIMILEGEALGYHRDPEFVDRQYRLLSKRLIETLSRQVVGQKVQVTEAEVDSMYRTYHWDREILPAHILSATAEDALEVIRLLDQGRDFAEVARERSIAADADRGGFLGQYFGPNDAVSEFVDAAHGLPVGEYTRTPVRTRDGYEVIKVLDATSVPLDNVRQQLTRGIYYGKFAVERRGYVAALQKKHGVVFHVDGVDALVRAATDAAEAEGAAAALPVITFGETHSLNVADVRRFIVDNARLRGGADEAQVIQILTSRVLSDSLLVLEAQATGVDTADDYTEYRDGLYRRMIVTFLRKRKVLEQITISEADVRQEYERGKEGFSKPDQVNAREILVATRGEADAVARRLREGEAAVDLVRTLSLRSGAARSEGHVHIGANDADRWGDHFNTVWDVSEGDVVGPLEMTDGFLVLQIEAVEKGQLRSFEEMRLGLTHRLKLTGQYEAFEKYIEQLRQQYADRVVWHDDRITSLAEHPPWEEVAP